jgi:hypothetical protein
VVASCAAAIIPGSEAVKRVARRILRIVMLLPF